ncbi:MAG: glycoside hydrolase family 3 C-terminal domain-containing protein, partial [Clostridia bacterium]|nr:glycoside hydrolase family 3 C-terminal domain-containing protein [Clostridia bacterium]
LKRDSELFLTEKNRDIVRRAAEECAVLLKNNGILPLDGDIKKIAVIGPFADTGKILGGWCCNGIADETVTVADGVRKLLPGAEVTVVNGCSALWDENSVPGLDAAVDAAKHADAVILCIGEPEDYTGESKSRTELKLSAPQVALTEAVTRANSNTVACVFCGRPIVLTEAEPYLNAILECWMPGTEGGNAVAELLFGRVNPSGKIPMSFPKATGQCPIYYSRPRVGRPVGPDAEYKFKPYASNYSDCGNLPLYPFGYGLSYTEFVYEELSLDSHTLEKDGSISVRVKVRNAGTRDGKEVVQLYFSDTVASVVRPEQKLLDFKKIEIKAGETASAEFTVTEPQLRFYDFNCRHISEAGEFGLFVGYADHKYLEDKFTLK